MQLFDKAKDIVKNQVKARVMKLVLAKGLLAAFLLLLKFIAIILLVCVVMAVISMIVDFFTATNTPSYLYESLGVEDIYELVEPKESEDGGYYWSFADGIDDKIDNFVKDTNAMAGLHNIPDTDESNDFIHKLLEAELCTQLPDLGGEVPDGADGFQGVIKIRRVTPDKEIGSMDNTGEGTTSTIEKETVDDNVDMSNSYIQEIQKLSNGQKLKVSMDATVYKETESQIEGSEGTGHWESVYDGSTSGDLIIPEGTEVYYTGNYDTEEVPLSDDNEVIVYVEVEDRVNDIKGYIRASTLIFNLDAESNNKIANDNKNTTSRARTNTATGTKTVGDGSEVFTVAIAAGHNNTDNIGARNGELIEEELTIEVAERVEELFQDYSNIKVVQTGSTSSNPGGIKKGERMDLAMEAGADLCIQIHFNAGGGTGVETIYKERDNVSYQLADILTKSISSAMGLEDRGAGTDIEKCSGRNLGIIASSAITGFPSVVTEGGFLDGNPDQDIIKNGGIDKYAQGIVNGVVEYLEADHSGYTSTVTNKEQVTDSIRSKVRNLQYVSMDTLKEYIDSGDERALQFYSLDENKRLITVSWSMEKSGDIVYKENTAVDLRTPLEKYVVPFEYLLFYYIDTDIQEFSEDLADIVLNTEIVVAVQDNITTVKQVDTVQNKEETNPSSYGYDWRDGNSTTTTTESCSTSIDITYIDAWCVKTYNENSYSSDVLNMGDKDEITVNIKGKVTETDSDSISESKVIDSGTKGTGQYDENGEELSYTYKTYERTKTHIDTMSSQYESGDSVTEEKVDQFVELYQKYNMYSSVREGYLFKMIEDNEKTANLLDLTKYLIYKATGNNTGVYEYDFSELGVDSFANIDAFYGDWDGTGSQEDFIAAVAPYAVIDMEQHQIYASATIAQAIIESRWGRDEIAIKYKNFFGMKAGKAGANEFWSGDSVSLNASEGGVSAFRVYDSLKNSVYDHGRNFHVTSTYGAHGVLDCISQNLGPKEQLRRIAISGYAVYSDGSISKPDGVRTYDVYLYEEFIQKYDLEKYDKMTSSDFASTEGNQEIIEIAKSKLGCPYKWGAEGPDSFDCSGFVKWVYQQIGISVPRTTASYKPYLNTSKEISWAEAQPGDIVWRNGHVGIYLGEDQYIHAPHTGDVVKISSGAKEAFTNVFRFSE